MYDVGDYCEESSDESGKSDDMEASAAILPETTLKKYEFFCYNLHKENCI